VGRTRTREINTVKTSPLNTVCVHHGKIETYLRRRGWGKKKGMLWGRAEAGREERNNGSVPSFCSGANGRGSVASLKLVFRKNRRRFLKGRRSHAKWTGEGFLPYKEQGGVAEMNQRVRLKQGTALHKSSHDLSIPGTSQRRQSLPDRPFFERRYVQDIACVTERREILDQGRGWAFGL